MRADMANARADRWKDRHDKERAARLALVAEIEALIGDIERGLASGLGGDRAETLGNVTVRLRALLPADDTEGAS